MSANYELRGDVAVITLDNPPVNGLATTRAAASPTASSKRARRSRPSRRSSSPAPARRSRAAPTSASSARRRRSPSRTCSRVILALEASPKPVVAAIHGVAHGRRARARARLPLPRRRAGRADRAARSEARPAPRRRRHAAPAARARRRDRAQHDRQRRAGARASCSPSCRARSCSTRSSTATSSTARGRVRARGGRRAAAAAACATCKVEHPNADAYFQFARNTVGAMAQELPGAAEVRRRGRRVDEDEVRRRHEARARALHGADADARVARRCATCSWPSARPAKIPDVPDDTPTRAIKKVAVIGAGTMGGGIAMNFLNAGIPVDDARDEAGSARQGRRHHPQELRGAGQEGQAQAGQARRSAWRC